MIEVAFSKNVKIILPISGDLVNIESQQFVDSTSFVSEKLLHCIA